MSKELEKQLAILQEEKENLASQVAQQQEAIEKLSAQVANQEAPAQKELVLTHSNKKKYRAKVRGVFTAEGQEILFAELLNRADGRKAIDAVIEEVIAIEGQQVLESI